ncbi:MAG TPA: hypothetical protein VHL59_10790, partial [Thermoanaerobaculia bacterium]|nr:hypothetical protein [Thermoanaerobaculia bacterium]
MSAAVNLILAGSAIALAVALAFAAARHAPPRVRYASAVLAFLAAAILPFVERTARVERGAGGGG